MKNSLGSFLRQGIRRAVAQDKERRKPFWNCRYCQTCNDKVAQPFACKTCGRER